MRIRKRPPQHPPLPLPVEASVVDEARGVYSGRRREGEGVLHPQPQGGDLPIDPHGGWGGARPRPRPRRNPIHTHFLQDLPPPPPPPHQYPAADQIKSTSSPPPQPQPHHHHVDVCIPDDNHAGQMKVAEIEKKVVDSDKMGGGQVQVQVNSKIKWTSGGSSSSSSGAELSGGMVIMAASGGEGEAKTRTRRTSAATSFTYLASSSAIDDTKSSEDDDYTGAREVNGRKRRSPAVLMEGSRCSRVNGRGWRCCQQTLVGYSLCEHHLGKGRLRSMSSVRGQLGGSKGKKNRAPDTVDDHGEEEDEDKSSVTKKRKKIGIVKARSISSLLGDTVNPAATMMAAAPPEAGEAMAAQPSASAAST